MSKPTPAPNNGRIRTAIHVLKWLAENYEDTAHLDQDDITDVIVELEAQLAHREKARGGA